MDDGIANTAHVLWAAMLLKTGVATSHAVCYYGRKDGLEAGVAVGAGVKDDLDATGVGRLLYGLI